MDGYLDRGPSPAALDSDLDSLADGDSNHDSDSGAYQETLISIPDSTLSDEESEGGLFVEQDPSESERSASPASIITLSSQQSSRSSSEPVSDQGFFGNRPDLRDLQARLAEALEEAHGDNSSDSGDSQGTEGQDPDASPHSHFNEHRHPFLFDNLHEHSDLSDQEDNGLDEDAVGPALRDLVDFGRYWDVNEIDDEHEVDAEIFRALVDNDRVDRVLAPHPRLASMPPGRPLANDHAADPLDAYARRNRASATPNEEEELDMDMADYLYEVEFGRGQGAAARAGQNARDRASQNEGQRAQHQVIDLTLEDDEVEVISESQNARRQQSQRRDNAPRLNRSDGSYVGDRNVGGNNQDVILLSSDDDSEHDDNEVAVHRVRRPRRAAQPYHNHQPPNQNRPHLQHHNIRIPPIIPPVRPLPRNQDRPIMEPIMAGNGGYHPLHRQLPNNMRQMLFAMARGGNEQGLQGLEGLNHIDLDYQHNPFAQFQQPAPPAMGPQKPQHEPPPKPRDGFTRDLEEEQVIICPSCDEELAYDPAVEDENGPPTKRVRSRKDQAEHYFWAVKECGHVFCKKCYDNRKPTTKSKVKAGFRPCAQNSKKLICAVDGCNSDVAPKGAWIGLFLA
ncbi:hypothetical protein BJ166DRAFT_21336 [Pestalotiopsis sp. NC0098]|nr:hypothetical protein BJ166DRAFT_21336 [Pestalotiopsis sp. NC0098]